MGPDEEPIKVDAVIVSSPSLDAEIPVLPESFHPRSRKWIEYYGFKLKEFQCYYVEKTAERIHGVDNTFDLDSLKIQLASWQKLTMCDDFKVALAAGKLFSDVVGLSVAWEHKKNAKAIDVTVTHKLSDLIIEAASKARLLRKVD